MEMETQLNELAKRVKEHREVLLTEEAAKNALVMPFIRALGYDPFNPAEVVPEFTADVGTKKGEKVDYAICSPDGVLILIECKPAHGELKIEHASQLYRYFTTTDARLAILTNGVTYKFFCDLDSVNRMDERPFFTFSLESFRKSDIRHLASFAKGTFDVERILEEAGTLKAQSLVVAELLKEFAEPSDEFIRLIAGRVTSSRLTASAKDLYRGLITGSIQNIIRDQVNERLTTALSASSPRDEDIAENEPAVGDIMTTPEEIDGFHIVRAIAARMVDPKRVHMRDAKSYCAILLDDNNRKTIARLHFNSPTSRYLGVFSGKDENRHPVCEPIDLYQHQDAIQARVEELLG